MDFSLPHDLSSIDNAPAVQTARWQLNGRNRSEVLERMSQRNSSAFNPSMPPLGTEVIDEQGIAAVEALLAELPSNDGD